ncbi:glycosyltransferase [Nostocoides sp. HKS02]|uniref:glycosyltransferase n=1 Tax=Nostocoides sp. HKS02 TaxID=1813880 RepID=UPI0012B4D411|nr:glycosyltransferase [Tetrasphaera sp. HKS02]QGN59152.1 glycosyltransferase [Tetrasphaera sp. HKS02]
MATFHNYRLLCATGDFFRAGQPCHDCATGIGMPGVQHGCYRGSHLATIPVVAANAAHRSAWQRLLSAYVFISASQRDLMSALELPADRVFVKHNLVVSPPSPAPSPRLPEHQVTYVGRLDAAKGIPLLMQSWDAFRAQSPSSALRLVVVGAGPMEDAVRAWAAHHPSVEVVGLVPRDKAVSVLGRSLAAVVTSQWEETFGLVAVEAMAVGVAPIAPDRGSFPELIGDSADGSLYRAGDPTSLAAALTDLDRDPQRYVELGRRARASYERRFQPEANLDQLLDIYRFAMAHPVEGLQRALRTSATG